MQSTESAESSGPQETTEELLVAQPSDEASVMKVDAQTEVASSEAFQCINDEYYAFRLSSTEIAMLKSRYMKLHDALQKTRENEYSLSQLVKTFMAEIDEQTALLIQVDQFPENAMTEPAQLRAQILGNFNMAMQIDERVEQRNYQIAMLREERNLLVRDFSRLPTAELSQLDEDVDIVKEMERRMKVVQVQCQDFWLDIDVLKLDAKRSREQLRQVSDGEQEINSELLETINRMSQVKAEWVITSDLPQQHSKETERFRKHKSNAEKELQTLSTQYNEMSQQMYSLDIEVKEARARQEVARQQLADIYRDADGKRELLVTTEKSEEGWYELEMLNRTEKARLLQRNLLGDQDKKELFDEVNKLNREIESVNRNLKRVQLQCESLTDSLRSLQPQHDKVRARYAVTPKYDGEMASHKRRLSRAMQKLQQEIEEERKIQATMKSDMSRTVASNQRRLCFLEHSRAENWELLRLTVNIGEGLTKAVQEYNSAKTKCDRFIAELKEKEVELAENEKQLEELNGRLHDISELYSQTKLERNKCVGLLKTTLKVGLDSRDRLRLLGNEVDILSATLSSRDQAISKENMMISSSIVQRDHKRYELCQISHILMEQKQRRIEIRLRCQRINSIYNQIEAETLAIKRVKERNAKMRNEQAIGLIERNQEVYVLQERTKAQTDIEQQAQVELKGLEEEINFLQLYHTQLERFNEINKNVGKTKELTQIERDGYIHELIGARADLFEITKTAENPDSLGRLKILGGKDPSPGELWIQLGRIERRMAAKEEEMSEKNLTYEAVCRLVDSLQVLANVGKNDTLKLASKVNGVKSHIQKLTNEMKTMNAELVIRASEREKMQNLIKALEFRMDLFYVKLRSGIVPSPTWEKDWRHNHLRTKAKPSRFLQEEIKIKPMRSPAKKRSRVNKSTNTSHGQYPSRRPGETDSLTWHSSNGVQHRESHNVTIMPPLSQANKQPIMREQHRSKRRPLPNVGQPSRVKLIQPRLPSINVQKAPITKTSYM